MPGSYTLIALRHVGKDCGFLQLIQSSSNNHGILNIHILSGSVCLVIFSEYGVELIIRIIILIIAIFLIQLIFIWKIHSHLILFCNGKVNEIINGSKYDITFCLLLWSQILVIPQKVNGIFVCATESINGVVNQEVGT